MANKALVAGLWVIAVLVMSAAVRFVFTALAAPGDASQTSAYHRDFARARIPYYFAVWAGLGLFVFFGSRALLAEIPSSLGLAFLDRDAAGGGSWRDALAAGLAFCTILFVHQLSVMREHVTRLNRREREAALLREHVQKLVEELDFMDGASAHEIRAFFYNCKADIEAATSGLTSEDRDLLRGILALARRGIPEMEGIERPNMH